MHPWKNLEELVSADHQSPSPPHALFAAEMAHEDRLWRRGLLGSGFEIV